MTQHLDITPTPRILRTLGDIPFEPWQCLAELVDNAIDAFLEAKRRGHEVASPRIDINWSSEATPIMEREVIVEDNGPGMSLDQLQKAAQAGYTNNDPIHNLGLFGMGFNIATARLGEETTLLAATKESTEWSGIKIDFEDLIKNKAFIAPVVRERKKDPSEAGVRVIVRKLKDGVHVGLKSRKTTIRRRLESIYTPLLGDEDIQVFLQGTQLRPRPHCVWGKTRYVIRRGVKVFAVQEIDRDLGETWFDTQRNRYLSSDEAADLDYEISRGGEQPSHILKRPRKLSGWVGIQRYADPTDFGVDFIRNGRKILVGDRVLFGFENPDTGNVIQEYPVELGSTLGGRIVGELHVDYLIPTYQKNGFDSTDSAWRLTLEAVRGAGPILPKHRKALGYDDENDSPIGRLVNAYRRLDPGTKSLAISNKVAKLFADNFRKGDSDYQNDDAWFQAAQEADRERGEGTGTSTPVNAGETPSDDVELYLGEGEEPQEEGLTSGEAGESQPLPSTTDRDSLLQNAEKEMGLSGDYRYGRAAAFKVMAWRSSGSHIRSEGERVPCVVYLDGVNVDFFYDPTHEIFAEYPITPKQILLQLLAERFALRDRVKFLNAYMGLIVNHLEDERINPQNLFERVQAVMNNIREQLPVLLSHRREKVLALVKAVPSEEEELVENLLTESQSLLTEYQDQGDDAIQALSFVPDSTVSRIIKAFPEDLLDGKLFDQPYLSIDLPNKEAVKRLRDGSLKKILSYVDDLLTFSSSSTLKMEKYELIRHAQSLMLLEQRLVSQ